MTKLEPHPAESREACIKMKHMYQIDTQETQQAS